MGKYRLYVDEVGNADLGASHDPNHRYLSLTGVIMGLDYVDSTAQPTLETLKRKYFGSHVDEPLVLHRAELVNKRFPFHALRDEAVEAAFNADLLVLLEQLNYVVLTTVIDKLEHVNRYKVWRFDPYHYCLMVVVERYVKWLRRHSASGDVMAEARGGKEDRRLKDAFERVYAQGSMQPHMGADVFQAHLTSKQLKVKKKDNNIAGLQLADLIAHPSYRATRARQDRQPLPQNFGGRIAEILEASKYDRSPAGFVSGWGQKWLP